MLKVKIGKGEVNKIGHRNSFTPGLRAVLDNKLKKLTLEEIAWKLANQYEVNHGSIELNFVSFQVIRYEGLSEEKPYRG